MTSLMTLRVHTRADIDAPRAVMGSHEVPCGFNEHYMFY